MPVKQGAWAEGTPAWVDLMAADLEQAKSFYAELFGWEYDQSGEDFGNYATARLRGEAAAGIGPAQGPDAPPPAWTTYLAVSDAAATAEKAAAAGGAVLMPVMEIGPFGAMAVLADPTGTVFGLWQAGSHTGADIFNEPGAYTWNEAMVGDYEAGKQFYAEVFGYGYDEIGNERMRYSTIQLGGRSVGGIGPVGDVGPDVPPHWRTYFSVADVAATCARAEELGGSVVMAPFDTPFGQMAALKGPGGEVFLLNQAPAAQAADADPTSEAAEASGRGA